MSKEEWATGIRYGKTFQIHLIKWHRLSDVGATCLKDKDGRIFLDELPTWRGDPVQEIVPDCSLICQIEFQEIIDRQVDRVIKGEISINDVA